jgi:hypothetical protein
MSTATMLSRTAQIASSGFTRCTVQIRCTRAARDVATSAQLQCDNQRIQHRLRHPAQIAPLQPGVVLDAHSGQLGDLRPT